MNSADGPGSADCNRDVADLLRGRDTCGDAVAAVATTTADALGEYAVGFRARGSDRALVDDRDLFAIAAVAAGATDCDREIDRHLGNTCCNGDGPTTGTAAPTDALCMNAMGVTTARRDVELAIGCVGGADAGNGNGTAVATATGISADSKREDRCETERVAAIATTAADALGEYALSAIHVG